MMRWIFILGIMCASNSLWADAVEDARALLQQGQVEPAADAFLAVVTGAPNDAKRTPAALVGLARALENMSDIVNTRAENECYRKKGSPKSAACMHQFAARLSQKYGAGSFEYMEQLIIIRYTGAHYRQVMERFPKSPEAAGADYYLLTKNVVGKPDEVLPRVQAFLKRHPEGEWYRKGLLLLARLNEDIWWIHRNWWWLLYNWNFSQDDAVVRAEPYRQEALRTFSMIMKKFGKTDEGKIAEKEHALLKAYKSDDKLYGIVNDAMIEGGASR